MKLTRIGTIHSPWTRQEGTPIQPALADGARGRVEVDEAFAEALRDLDGFDRIWLLYWFDRSGPARMTVTPYMDTEPRGLFATRAPCRPNPLGLSCVRLLGVEGRTLRIADVDILDGTPLLDIKPYSPHFDVFDVERGGWLDRATPERTVADERFSGDETGPAR